MIKVGYPAPEFTLDGTSGAISLSDYKNHMNVMLIFYPLDWTGT